LLKVSARIFPIGYIISVDNPNFDPHDFYIDGVWERIKGRVVVGVDENQTEFNETGKTGGEKTHTLTVEQIPAHNHRLGFRYGSDPTSTSFEQAYASFPHMGSGEIARGYAPDKMQNVGSGAAHNNLQPYYVAYIWKLVSYSN
jgi:microcystin-dependent protein